MRKKKVRSFFYFLNVNKEIKLISHVLIMPYKNKELQKEYQKQYRKKHKSYQKTYQKSYRNSLKGKYNAKKGDAKQRHKEFTLTFKEYVTLTINQHCSYCGKFCKYATIDRFNNNEGYNNNNCVPCCFYCNTMKSDLSYSEFKNHIQRISKNLEKYF